MELVAHLQELVQGVADRLEGVSRRRVLASDGWFVAGRLFALVNRQARVVVKLPEVPAQDEALSLEGAEPWQIGKKAPMRAWVQLPEAFHEDEEALAQWVERAWALNRNVTTAGGPRRPSPRRGSGRTRPRSRRRASR